jgi:hypothetical protein
VQGLLRRISEQLQQILQQQPQQQPCNTGQPVKWQRLEAGSGAAAAAATGAWQPHRHQQQQQQQGVLNEGPQQPAGVAGMLLNAHDAALQQQGGVDLEWRLGFLQLLQQATALHRPLLQLLQASMAGMHGEYEPQQVRRSCSFAAYILWHEYFLRETKVPEQYAAPTHNPVIALCALIMLLSELSYCCICMIPCTKVMSSHALCHASCRLQPGGAWQR